MDDRRSHNADITGSHGNRMGGKYVFTGSTKHIDHLKKSVRMQKSRSIPVLYMTFSAGHFIPPDLSFICILNLEKIRSL